MEVPERIFTLVVCLLLAGHAVTVLRDVIRTTSWISRTRCLAWWRSIQARARRAFTVKERHGDGGAAAEDRILTMLVEEAARRKQVRLVKDACRYMSHMVALAFCRVLYNICFTGGQLFMSPGQSVLGIFVYILFFLAARLLSKNSAWSLRVFCLTANILLGSWVLTGAEDMQTRVFCMGIAFPIRWLLSLFMMDACCVLFGNFVASCLIVIAILDVQWGCEGEAALPRTSYIMYEAYTTLLICLGSSVFRKMIFTLSRNEVELRASKSETYATVKVLNALCDAVVQLDGRLLVADAETKLAALLLHGPGRCLTGSDFSQYLFSEDDRQSFREWLKAPSEPCEHLGDDRPGLESKLRDSAGSPIGIEMFHVPFEKVPGVLNHVIAIREKGGEASWAVKAVRPGDAPAQAAGIASPADSDALSEASSDRGALDEDQPLPEVSSCPVFTFDASTFKITGRSLCFNVGSRRFPPNGCSLVPRLSKCDVNALFFRNFGHNSARLAALARESLEHVELTYSSAMLFTPRSCRERYLLDVTVTLSTSSGPTNDREEPWGLLSAEARVVVHSIIRQDEAVPRAGRSRTQSVERGKLGPGKVVERCPTPPALKL